MIGMLWAVLAVLAVSAVSMVLLWGAIMSNNEKILDFNEKVYETFKRLRLGWLSEPLGGFPALTTLVAIVAVTLVWGIYGFVGALAGVAGGIAILYVLSR
jgi:hypothetical protein